LPKLQVAGSPPRFAGLFFGRRPSIGRLEIRGGDLLPHQLTDDVRRGFTGGYRPGQKIIRGKGINRYRTGGLGLRLPPGEKSRPVGTGPGRVPCPFLVKSVIFFFGQIRRKTFAAMRLGGVFRHCFPPAHFRADVYEYSGISWRETPEPYHDQGVVINLNRVCVSIKPDKQPFVFGFCITFKTTIVFNGINSPPNIGLAYTVLES
jgi:hypothetical protein